MRLHAALALLCLALLPPASLADDFYVDSLHGDDDDGDGSAAAPWRSVTHAFETIPDPLAGSIHAVHLAPGLYDASSGEVFPIELRSAFEVASQAGSSATTLDSGTSSQPLFTKSGYLVSLDPGTALRGLTLRSQGVAVSISFSGGSGADLCCSDLAIRGAVGGIAVSAGDLSSVRLELEHVRLVGNQNGLTASANDGSVSILASDCDFSHNWASGLALFSYGGPGGSSADLELSNCRVDGNTHGVHLDAGGNAGCGLLATRTSLCANGVGLRLPYAPAEAFEPFLGVRLDYCTLNANSQAGIRATSPASLTPRDVYVHGCIVFGNELDVEADPTSPSVHITWSDVGSGSFDDAGHNLATPPLFAGLVTGDWWLAADSPCIDAGDPADGSDADGTPLDLGAHPFDAQHVPGSERYCQTTPNSAGAGASMAASGTSLHARNDLTLVAVGCPAQVNGLFFFGPGSTQLPFANGYLCVSGPLHRLPVLTTGLAGQAQQALDTGPAGSWPGLIEAGSTWQLQFYFRDPAAAGASAGTSDGLRLRFEP